MVNKIETITYDAKVIYLKKSLYKSKIHELFCSYLFEFHACYYKNKHL
jgi:hypothetical protein